MKYFYLLIVLQYILCCSKPTIEIKSISKNISIDDRRVLFIFGDDPAEIELNKHFTNCIKNISSDYSVKFFYSTNLDENEIDNLDFDYLFYLSLINKSFSGKEFEGCAKCLQRGEFEAVIKYRVTDESIWKARILYEPSGSGKDKDAEIFIKSLFKRLEMDYLIIKT